MWASVGVAGLNAQDVTQLGGVSWQPGGSGELKNRGRDVTVTNIPLAEPELRRDERRGGGEDDALCASQGLGPAAAAAPVPKSVSEWGKTVSGAGPERLWAANEQRKTGGEGAWIQRGEGRRMKRANEPSVKNAPGDSGASSMVKS